VCFILGAVDTGKTTLAEAVARRSALNKSVGFIDADIGQSWLGPPATVGWARVTPKRFSLREMPAEGFSFVGHVTPAGHFLQLTAAVHGGIEALREDCRLIVVDTPGLVYGSAAQAFWWCVFQIARPRTLLALQKKNELEDILRALENLDVRIERVRGPSGIKPRDRQQRADFRQQRFKEYFRQARTVTLSLKNVSIQYPSDLRRDESVNRLVCLRDGRGNDLALAVVTDWLRKKRTLQLIAPRLETRQVRCIAVGDMTLDPGSLT
jgi:polynucleotide 5'-hydroxyl-kinase GRC3/NOL9